MWAGEKPVAEAQIILRARAPSGMIIMLRHIFIGTVERGGWEKSWSPKIVRTALQSSPYTPLPLTRRLVPSHCMQAEYNASKRDPKPPIFSVGTRQSHMHTVLVLSFHVQLVVFAHAASSARAILLSLQVLIISHGGTVTLKLRPETPNALGSPL